jgi:mono/diheme cytochrome c family protein
MKPAAILFSTLLLALPPAISADEIDFSKEVRPILERHCFSCHGPTRQKSSLRLDLKASTLKGGEAFGPALVAGKPDQSPLLRLVRGDEPELRMPPKGDPLSAAEIATLEKWIRDGAEWPQEAGGADPVDDRSHWSFQPLKNPAPPSVQNSSWPKNEIDRFILSRLEAENLHPSPSAQPVEWLRRVSFDLTGLPPTSELASRFLSNPSESAYERAVDELLESPRYGERWAQHWLDVVRFADTHGFEVNTERPNAWHYRDYVIRAFNNDTPYDRFIREQIVGDALDADTATGFLVTASVLLPGQIGKDEPSKRLARHDALDEILVNVSQTFLGLSIGCARCHDHKFDPISQREYYSLLAFFAGVEYGDRKLPTPAAQALAAEQKIAAQRLREIESTLTNLTPLAGSGNERPSIDARLNVDRFPPIATKRLRFTIHATNNLEPCLDELEVFAADGQNVAAASHGTTVTSSGDLSGSNRHKLAHINDGRYGNARSWISNEPGKGWIEFDFFREHTINRVVWARDREGKFTDRLAVKYQIEVIDTNGAWHTVADSADRKPYQGTEKKPSESQLTGLTPAEQQTAKQLTAEKKQLESRIKSLENGQRAFAGIFRAPDPIHLLFRGDPEQPKDEVSPAVPQILGTVDLTRDSTDQSRRTALAAWLTNPDNPLVTRVWVNRIWQGHFGQGLVETTSDFGRNGLPPSHPELLDWLASELLRAGWSNKPLHRSIVLSATYRQSSQIDPTAAAKDGDVRLLWRFPRARLDAETIRDSMLAVSGRLNLKMYGPGFDLFDRRGGLTGFTPVESFKDDGLRRLIYAHKVRRERDAVFGAFDCPDGGQSTSRRRESTTPLQALNLLNSRFTSDAAAHFAARIRLEALADPTAQVRHAYQLAYTRDPMPDELADARKVVQTHGLATLCRAIFNSNEFLFLP